MAKKTIWNWKSILTAILTVLFLITQINIEPYGITLFTFKNNIYTQLLFLLIALGGGLLSYSFVNKKYRKWALIILLFPIAIIILTGMILGGIQKRLIKRKENKMKKKYKIQIYWTIGLLVIYSLLLWIDLNYKLYTTSFLTGILIYLFAKLISER